VTSRVRTKGEDASYGGLRGSESVVMAGAEALLDAGAIGKGEEGDDEVVRVRDWVDVDGVVARGGLVHKINDSCGPSQRRQKVEGIENLGMGPGKACWDAEGWEGSRE